MTDDTIICGECKKEVPVFSKYWKHETGKILCEACFKKLSKEGKIK